MRGLHGPDRTGRPAAAATAATAALAIGTLALNSHLTAAATNQTNTHPPSHHLHHTTHTRAILRRLAPSNSELACLYALLLVLSVFVRRRSIAALH